MPKFIVQDAFLGYTQPNFTDPAGRIWANFSGPDFVRAFPSGVRPVARFDSPEASIWAANEDRPTMLQLSGRVLINSDGNATIFNLFSNHAPPFDTPSVSGIQVVWSSSGGNVSCVIRQRYDFGSSIIMYAVGGLGFGEHNYNVEFNYETERAAVFVDGQLVYDDVLALDSYGPVANSGVYIQAATYGTINDIIILEIDSRSLVPGPPPTVTTTYEYSPLRALSNYARIINPFGIRSK